MRWIFGWITIWLIFVVSLSGWWMIFGMSNLELLSQSNIEYGSQLYRHQKMLFYEGLVLVISQLAGGLSLFYLTYRMYKEKSTTEQFFASFTHDLKTALFRLQLQVENLEGREQVSNEDISEVLSKTRRLNLHLENGLDSALGKRQKLFIETVDLGDFLSDLHTQWPELEIQLKGSEKIRADRKALRSVFKNLLHNSLLHGEADHVVVSLQNIGDQVNLSYTDNGHEFKGSLDHLGEQPQTSEKGSGFGLYLARFWLQRMRGNVNFEKSDAGQLIINMSLPRAQ